MAPSRVAGGFSQSSASSGVFFQGDAQGQHVFHSHLSSSFGNSANSISGTGHSHLGSGSGDVVLNSVATSGPSVGASSLVTDANSAFSGGPQLQRSASINTESYLRLPASPMSFTSNYISVSGSSVIDGPTNGQQGAHHDPNSQQVMQSQQLQQGSGATSLPASQTGQLPLNMGSRVPNSILQDASNFSDLQKKPRLDNGKDDIFQQQVLQQLLQRQDPTQLQGANPQLHAILQQQRLQQQQLLQSVPMQRMQLQQQQQQQQHQQQQQQQQQLRQQLQRQGMQQMAAMKNPYDTGGVCARRLMQYLYHQRQRPLENSIAYWRKFVAEYYAPRGKKRWCLSLYDNVGNNALGIFPQASMDAWHCDICGSKSGRGFEATYEVLPRLNEIEFGSGVIDELLFVDLPREQRLANGIMVLEYGKSVQESVYEQLRVVREGQLRIIFTQDLKILSWDFCARRHEVLLPRRLVAPQVNELLEVAQKCRSTLTDSGSDEVSSQDLQANSNMVVTAAGQLAKSLELPSLNDLGFSKRYVRCLQIAEVVDSMKSLVDFCQDNKVGPIEGLKTYPRHDSTPRLPMQRMQEMEQEQLTNLQGLPTDRNTMNRLMSVQPGVGTPNMGNNPNMLANSRGALSGSAAAGLALPNYKNVMMRQNSMNSGRNSMQLEASSSFNNANQSSSPSFQGASGLLSGSMQNLSSGGYSNSHLSAQQQHQLHGQQQQSLSSNSLQQSSQGNQHSQGQALQQHVIQQLLQDVANNNNVGGQQKAFNGQNVNVNTCAGGLRHGYNTAPSTPTASGNAPGGGGPTQSKSNSFKAPSNSDSSAAGGGLNSRLNQQTADLRQNIHLTDDMVPDIPHDFAESGFFSNDLDDNMGYDWKA